MKLTDKKMIKILKEEYEKRLREYITEKIQMTYKSGDEEIDVWKDADQEKVVHDDTGIMYTFAGYEGDKVKLYLPDEPRFLGGHKGNKLLTSDPGSTKEDLDVDQSALQDLPMDSYLPDDNYDYDRPDEVYYEVDETELESDERDYILVDKDEFVEKYSLA